jgi:hypothetical protein
VSTEGFIGWEVDPYFTHVELFDEKTDEENAYVSFVMPDGEPSIAALYTEVPNINFENTRNMIMAMRDMHEYGSSPAAASSATINPERGEEITVPPAEVNRPYNIILNNPAGVLPGNTIRWDWDFPKILDDWISWHPDTRGGSLRGTPRVVTAGPGEDAIPGGPFPFSVDIIDITAGESIGFFQFWITILPQNPPAAFLTTRIPHAMVGVPYDVQLMTQGFPSGSVWELNPLTGISGTLPPGLKIESEQLDTTQFFVRGTPLAAALETPGPNYSFRITVDDGDAIVVPTGYLNITIYDRPVITAEEPLRVLVTEEEIIGAILLPGIATGEGVENNRYESELTVDPFDALTVLNANWAFVLQSGRLPDNLRLSPPPTAVSATTASITGFPSAPGNPTFTIRYRANTNAIIGWVDYVYSIEIYAPPQFTTDANALRDGMDWRPLPTRLPEPADSEYTSGFIRASGTDINAPTQITWSWTAAEWDDIPTTRTLPPGDPSRPIKITRFGDDAARITGYIQNTDGAAGTGTSRNYSFDVVMTASWLANPTANPAIPPNPNIDGVTVTKEYNIWVWMRRYLNIDISDGITTRFVRRIDSVGDEDNDIDWNAEDWHVISPVRESYREKRAVMPGTYGQIRTPFAPFVRWEVRTNPLPTNSNQHVKIGGPENYYLSPNGLYQYVNIEMPSFAKYEDGTLMKDAEGLPIPVDGDVYIRGINAPPPSWFYVLNPGTVDDITSGGFVEVLETDLGSLSDTRPVSWVNVTVPDPDRPFHRFPPGLRFSEGDNFVSTIQSIRPGGPTTPGFYSFTLGINLKGTMRVENTFYMTINAVPGIRLGDVNGDGQVNLADLVLLTLFVDGRESSLPNRDAGNIESKPGERPHGGDLRILREYFSQPHTPTLEESAASSGVSAEPEE